LNVHFHTLFADGVFYKTGDGGYEFLRLPEPSKDDIRLLVTKIHGRVLKLIEKLGFNNHDQFEFEALSEMAAISIQQKSAFGEQAGGGLRRYGPRFEVDPEDNDPYSARVEGFSLNARVWIAGNEREKLEKLIRYMARGPIATERLSESFPDLLIYKMKTPWRDGTTHVSFSRLDFIARLVALVPPPKMNMVRYHGVFAPNFRDRSLIVPRPVKPVIKPEVSESDSNVIPIAQAKVRRERMRWSDMLKRTFKIDVTICSRCSGRLEQIAIIKDRAVAKAILESLKETTVFNPLGEILGRGPPDAGGHFQNEFDQRQSW
jgi:hypothetical protein